MRALTLLILLSCLPALAWSHKASDGFVYLDVSKQSGRLDLALTDLHNVVDLDDNADGQLMWREVTQHKPALLRYITSHFKLRSAKQLCHLNWQDPALTRHSDGYHLAFLFAAECAEPAPWEVEYSMLFERDALHRGLLHWQEGTREGLGVLSPERSLFTLPQTVDWRDWFADYFRQGVTHLLQGYDHLLFLLALMLPVIRQISQTSRVTAGSTENNRGQIASALFDILAVVTLFTLAHSLTLALAALDVVRPPPALVEIVIALSVSVAGGLALVPQWHRYRRALALGFGLIHGFGFANVLFELAPSIGQRSVSLLAFNLGVEAAQAMLVLSAIPLLFMFRSFLNKHRWLVPGSAYIVAFCGAFWLWERIV